MRIGYLVPEFPGQTHAFFWREITALERLGVSVDLVSTRRPSRGLAPHRWAEEAIARTTYLHPPNAMQAVDACWRLVRCGPTAWWRCGGMVAVAASGSLRGGARTAGLAVMGARIVALARQRGWSHLHVHSCADAATAAVFAHLVGGVPYSLTLHGDLNGYGKHQQSKWRHASFAIVVCRALRRQVAELIGSSLPSSILIAPMGVDVETFRRQATYVPYRGEGPLRIFSCGRLHPGKGHEDLIRAVAALHQHGLDVTLTIAGDDADGGLHRAHLNAVIEEAGLCLRVRLAGALSEQGVRDHLEHAHLFALASHQEALGVATMEAMAMELPVIVTRTGGVPELVNDGCEGVLVEPRNPAELAAAIQRCAHSPDACGQMGRAGRRRIEASFHSGVSARAIVEGIEQAQARRSSSQAISSPQAATP